LVRHHGKRDAIDEADVVTSFFWMNFAPGGTNFPHHHEAAEEIYLVVGGEGEMVAGSGMNGLEARFPAKAGDAYYFRPNCTVGFYNQDKPGAKAYILAVRSQIPLADEKINPPPTKGCVQRVGGDRKTETFIFHRGGMMPIGSSNRRSFVKLLAATPLLTQIAARNVYAQAASAVGRNLEENIYTRLGVKTVINCRGTWTYLSGSARIPGGFVKRNWKLRSTSSTMLDLQRAVGKAPR